MNYTEEQREAIKLLEAAGFKLTPPMSDDEVLALFDALVEKYAHEWGYGPKDKEMVEIVRARLVG